MSLSQEGQPPPVLQQAPALSSSLPPCDGLPFSSERIYPSPRCSQVWKGGRGRVAVGTRRSSQCSREGECCFCGRSGLAWREALCHLCVLSPPTAERADSTACGCAPQQPGDRQAAASQGELPPQLGLGESELGFPGDVGMWCACPVGPVLLLNPGNV